MFKSIASRLSTPNAERSRCALQNARRSDPPGSLRTTVPRRRADGRGPDGPGRGLAAGRVKASRRSEAGRAGARPSPRSPDTLQRTARRPGPADRLDKPDGRLLGEPVRRPRRLTEEDGPMNETSTETRAVVVEREFPFPPEKLWRALTQPHLIEEWLMKNDFKPVVDHRFNLRADWGAVDCQVLAVEPNKTLSYTWAAYGLESVVTWTLTPTTTGTHLRMEQSGFRPDQQQAYQGAKYGWQQFFANLEQVLARID